jgi:hypothetical protein
VEAALLVGIGAALLRHRWGAYLAISAVTVRFAAYLAAAAWNYRRTMRREWPKVEPLPDDDD